MCGESFPVGCQFAATLSYAHHFSSNPDRRRRQYSSLCGGCPWLPVLSVCMAVANTLQGSGWLRCTSMAQAFSHSWLRPAQQHAVCQLCSCKGLELHSLQPLHSGPCAAGKYSPGCGLASVQMSWSAAEHLHLVLSLNHTQLPPAALFLVRYQQASLLRTP